MTAKRSSGRAQGGCQGGRARGGAYQQSLCSKAQGRFTACQGPFLSGHSGPPPPRSAPARAARSIGIMAFSPLQTVLAAELEAVTRRRQRVGSHSSLPSKLNSGGGGSQKQPDVSSSDVSVRKHGVHPRIACASAQVVGGPVPPCALCASRCLSSSLLFSHGARCAT